MKQKTYWKSLKYKDGKIVSNYDSSEWTVGKYRNNPYPVVKECSGLNCCQHITDAMGFVRCEVLAEVGIRGKTIIGDDIFTAQEMKIIRAWKWKKIDSVALAIYAAELVIGYFEDKYPNDKRPRQAIESAKTWMADPTEKNAASAASAAYSAAYASAAYSAYSAASAAYSAAYASAASAAYSAYSAAYSASASAYSAYSASKKDKEKAREEMKSRIDAWIIARLETMEQIT